MCIKCIYIPRSTCFIYLWVPLERHSNTWAVLDLWYSPMGLAIDTKEKSVSKQRVSKISNFKQAAKWEFSSLQFKIGALVFYLFTPYIYTLLQQIYNIWTLCCVGHYKSRYQSGSKSCQQCLTSWNAIAVMPRGRGSYWCIAVCLILSSETYGPFAINSALHGRFCNIEQLSSAEIILFWVKVKFQCQNVKFQATGETMSSINNLSLPPFPYRCWFIVYPDSFNFLIKKQWIENWRWLFRIVWGLDPLGFLSLLQLNTSALKKFVLTSEVGVSYHFVVVSVSSHLQKCGNHCRDQDCWSVQQEKLYPVHKSLSQVWNKSHAANQKMNFILNQNSDQQIHPGI